jgi:Na+/melibiose symporter-like transporter
MSNIGNNEPSKKELVSYSLLAFCLSFVGLPIYIYLPNYYADNFAISLQSIALILLLTRLIDTIQDPLFGFLGDRFPYFKRKIITFLSPLLGASFLLLFYPIAIFSIEIWLSIFLITTYSLFSVIYIYHQSYAVSFSENFHLKTQIISYREIAFILGIITAVTTPSLLYFFVSETTAFLIIGGAYLCLITLFALLFLRYSPEPTPMQRINNNHLTKQKPKVQQHIKTTFRTIGNNRLLRSYLTVFLLNSIAASIPAALILFFIEEVINAKALAGLFLALYFFGLLIGVMLWTKISKTLNNKAKTFVISMIFTVFIFSWCYFLNEGDIVLYAVICLLAGIGFGGDLTLSYSILTDIIQKNNLQTNQTSLFGITNFMIKLSLTLSSATLIYVIGSLENNILYKKHFISTTYALLPIIFRLPAAIIMHKIFTIKPILK